MTKPTGDAPDGSGSSSEGVAGSAEQAVSEPTASSYSGGQSRASSAWSFLTAESSSVESVARVENVEPESSISAVVLSWLVERESLSPSMAVLSPLVVMLTLWEAAASAGSGLAAPASGLGTFVLLVLFERGHLVSGARVVRRRGDA